MRAADIKVGEDYLHATGTRYRYNPKRFRVTRKSVPEFGFRVVNTFKTREGAEEWVAEQEEKYKDNSNVLGFRITKITGRMATPDEQFRVSVYTTNRYDKTKRFSLGHYVNEDGSVGELSCVQNANLKMTWDDYLAEIDAEAEMKRDLQTKRTEIRDRVYNSYESVKYLVGPTMPTPGMHNRPEDHGYVNLRFETVDQFEQFCLEIQRMGIDG